jgi:ankyrin repeat protein
MHIRALIACACLAAASTVAAAADDLRLVDAVERQDWAAARRFIDQRVDVNARQADGTTAVAWASHWAHLETVDLLIRGGADVNLANDLGVTPLALATKNGNVPLVEKLLAANADPKLASSTGETPLMIAAHTGSDTIVRALLARGAQPDAAATATRQTPLMFAIAEGHAKVVKALLEGGADPRAKSAGGFTPLLFAARHGDTASASLLLDAGVDVNEAARDGSTPLILAAASRREDVAMLLLERGADPNAAGTGYTTLHTAMSRDLQRLAAALLKKGANPNARLTNAPATLFGPGQGAGSEVRPARAEAAPAQADANAQNRAMRAGGLAGATPFWLAARNVNVPMLRILLEHGADPTLTSTGGVTPLMVAAGLTQVQGPRANRGEVSQFSTNWGPEDSAEAVEFLIAHGADVNATNPSGQTALHGAAYMGADAVVRLLVRHGAKVNVQDAQGQTPYRLAEGHLNVAGQGVTEWPNTAAILREVGADTTLGVDGRTLLRQYVRPNP